MKPNYHPAVLPFSFPFFVFLVILYLHFTPPFEGDAASALSHPVFALPFPRQLFKWKYCGLSNAADADSNPDFGIYELSD